MNIARSTAAVLGAYTLTAALAYGQALLTFQDIKNFRQVGPEESVYEGGSLTMTLADGSVAILGCADNGSPVFVAPYIFCPSGTTGLVTQGDVDGDGLIDIANYFSIQQPIPAVQVEPFQESLISLRAAPPSDLPRPLGGFSWTDASVVIFYDLVTDPRNGVGFELTLYGSNRPYNSNELQRQRDEIVPGTYAFQFPGLGTSPSALRVFNMNSFYRPMAEMVPGPGGLSVESGGIQVGNDFRLTDDDRWQDGVMEFDPRLVFNFQWEGINTQTFIAGDRMFFSVRDPETDLILFPPFPDLRQFPQLIGSSQLGIPTGYELGPNFFNVGLELEVELEFARGNQIGNTTDASTRFFRWDIRLIDSFEGFQSGVQTFGDPLLGEPVFFLPNFPLNADEDLITPEADFDGDGYTNLEEFALQTSPTNPADVPVLLVELDGAFEQCRFEIPKRPNVGASLSYFAEFSFDNETWIRITRDDTTNWVIINDNEEVYSVLSVESFGDVPCFVRAVVEQNF